MERYPDYETIEYHLIYSELIKAARHRGTVTYQELAVVVGLPITGNNMGKRLGEILGAISQNEVIQGRPMLSAVAVKAGGKLGDGFFKFARELEVLNTDDPHKEIAFWENQKRQIYEIWQQKFPK
jgi:hypothetical protein